MSAPQPGKIAVRDLLKVRGIRRYTVGSVILAALQVSMPYVLGLFINQLVAKSARAWSVFALLLGVSLAALLLEMGLRRWLSVLVHRQEVQLQNRLLRQFCRLTPVSIDRYRCGEMGMKFFRDVPMVCTVLRDFYPQLTGAVFGVLFALGSVFYSSWQVGLVFLGILPVLAFLLWPFQKKMARLSHLYRTVCDRAFNRIFEFFHVFPFLKSLAGDEPYQQEPATRFQQVATLARMQDWWNIHFERTLRFCLWAGEFVILGVAGALALNGRIPVGYVVFYQGLFLSVLNSFSGVFRMLPSWKGIQESVSSLNELLTSEDFEDDNGEAMPLSGSIEVRDVTYRYRNAERNALEHCTLSIPAGSLTAIQGRNGTGKTTLLKLLTGYMEPTSGEILFDGVPLNQIQKSSIRRQTGTVFQEFLLVTGSLRSNVTLQNSAYTARDIQEACEKSCFADVVQRLPDHLEHRIGFDGGGLSGGECQKLAIARALIRNPRILVLDEVTNHLDRESKQKVKELLLALRGQVTVLLVSHDSEMLELCDQVISLT